MYPHLQYLKLVIVHSKYYEDISVFLCILDQTKLENVYRFKCPDILTHN